MDPAHFEAAAKGDINEYPFCDIDKPGMSTIFNKVSPSGNTMLHVAARKNHKDMVELMARYFPELITKTNNHEDTALHVTARAGNLEAVATLVYCAKQIPTTTYETDPNLLKIKNSEGNTALHDALLSLLASEYMDGTKSDKSIDSAAIALHLASEDPEVLYYQNKEGYSPLYLAVLSGRKDILEYLLTVVAEVHGSDDRMPEGKSPVHVAIQQKRLDLLETITETKSELLSLRDEKGNTPLHCAASIGFIEGVRHLLEFNHGSVLERNEKGLYPLQVACKYGQVEITKELLRKWPDPTELRCNKGRNMFHVAAKSGEQDVVSCIMEDANVGKLINQVDKDGNTPLHLAVRRGHYHVVGIFLSDNRIISTLKNNQGLTAYDIAVRQSEMLETEISKNHIIPEKDQQDHKSIVEDESSKAVGNIKKQPTKEDSQQFKTPDVFKALTTLSIFVFRSRSSFQKYCLSTKTRPLKSKKDVKNSINNLLVVATVIVGATFAAAAQIASVDEGNVVYVAGHSNSSASIENQNGKKEMKESTLLFLLFDTLAMHISIVAAFLLCWAQLVSSILASPLVQVVIGLLGSALYMTSAAFWLIPMRSNHVVMQIIYVIQFIFFLVQGGVLIPFLLPRIREALLLSVYYILFRCQFRRKQKN